MKKHIIRILPIMLTVMIVGVTSCGAMGYLGVFSTQMPRPQSTLEPTAEPSPTHPPTPARTRQPEPTVHPTPAEATPTEEPPTPEPTPTETTSPTPPPQRNWPGGLPRPASVLNPGVTRPRHDMWLQVNLAKQRVVAFVYDENGNYTIPIYAMYCSTGAVYGTTPPGIHYLREKTRWKVLNGDLWGQYSSRIVGGVLFHSVPYSSASMSTCKYSYYNRLGSPASSGCVRLTAADALWIYTYCAVGTPVEVMSDSSAPNYATYITPRKLSGSQGWDPTDPNPANPIYEPWPAAYPVIWNRLSQQEPEPEQPGYEQEPATQPIPTALTGIDMPDFPDPEPAPPPYVPPIEESYE